MNQDSSSAPTRKVRFTPKGPPRKKPVAPKIEEASDEGHEADDAAAQALLRRFNEHLGHRGTKVDKRSSVRVAFGQGSGSSMSIRSYGKPREGSAGKSDANEQSIIPSLANTSGHGIGKSSMVGVGTSYQKIKKDYKEPWDYENSNYPITLPLRRPYSGDPELLDEAEFGEGAAEYDEDVINSAAELGLLDENENAKMLFFQLPPSLPLHRSAAGAGGLFTADYLKGAKGKEKVGERGPLVVSPGAKGNETIVGRSSMSSHNINAPTKSCSLEDLPAGYMGKMLVYRNGAIKLKLGDVLYDVSPGSSSIFAQDVAAINTTDNHCCMVGELGKRAVVTPNTDSLLDNDDWRAQEYC